LSKSAAGFKAASTSVHGVSLDANWYGIGDECPMSAGVYRAAREDVHAGAGLHTRARPPAGDVHQYLSRDESVEGAGYEAAHAGGGCTAAGPPRWLTASEC
jgi:hypothetical protein